MQQILCIKFALLMQLIELKWALALQHIFRRCIQSYCVQFFAFKTVIECDDIASVPCASMVCNLIPTGLFISQWAKVGIIIYYRPEKSKNCVFESVCGVAWSVGHYFFAYLIGRRGGGVIVFSIF